MPTYTNWTFFRQENYFAILTSLKMIFLSAWLYFKFERTAKTKHSQSNFDLLTWKQLTYVVNIRAKKKCMWWTKQNKEKLKSSKLKAQNFEYNFLILLVFELRTPLIFTIFYYLYLLMLSIFAKMFKMIYELNSQSFWWN